MFAASSVISAQQKPELTLAKVQIEVADGLGEQLEPGEIKSFKNQDTGKDFATRFRPNEWLEMTATGIPYGDYLLRIAQPGFPEVERPVKVSSTEVTVHVYARMATVHIVDLGLLSTTDPRVDVVSLRGTEDDFDLAKAFSGNVAMKVPYGIYELRAHKAFSGTASRRVDVFKPEVWVVLDLDISINLPETFAPRQPVIGKINNISSRDEPVFVSLISVHGDYRNDDKVDVAGEAGTFRLEGFYPEGSKFLLVTTGRNGILDVRQIELPVKEPVSIDLDSGRK